MVTEHVVTEQDTAATVGSGDLPVLATPTLATWFEMATVAGAADMVEDGQTTVGTLLAIEHLRPSPVGATVTIHCSMPCLLYTSPSPRDRTRSRMPSSA